MAHREKEMKRSMVIIILALAIALFFLSCIRQTIHQDSLFLEGHSFNRVWRASLHAVSDIGFTVDSLDRDAGFIGAESGTHIGQEVPPRLSILLTESRGRVEVDCKMLQKEQFVDLFGHGPRVIRDFMSALNTRLNR